MKKGHRVSGPRVGVMSAHKHKKQVKVSVYGNAIMRFRKSQLGHVKCNEPEDLHPLLIGKADIDPLPVLELKGHEGMTKREILEMYGEKP